MYPRNNLVAALYKQGGNFTLKIDNRIWHVSQDTPIVEVTASYAEMHSPSGKTYRKQFRPDFGQRTNPEDMSWVVWEKIATVLQAFGLDDSAYGLWPEQEYELFKVIKDGECVLHRRRVRVKGKPLYKLITQNDERYLNTLREVRNALSEMLLQEG